MSLRTLGVWMAADEIDPWGENRADWRAAQIAAAVACSSGATKRDGSALTPDDFAPYLKLQVEPEELERIRIEREEAALVEFLMNASGRKATAYLDNVSD